MGKKTNKPGPVLNFKIYIPAQGFEYQRKSYTKVRKQFHAPENSQLPTLEKNNSLTF